jgi:hypothetical protein
LIGREHRAPTSGYQTRDRDHLPSLHYASRETYHDSIRGAVFRGRAAREAGSRGEGFS